MPSYHLYDRVSQQVVKFNTAYPAMNEARIEGLDPGKVYLKVITPAPPAHDTDTQQVERGTPVINDPGAPETLGTYTVTWQVVPKAPAPVPPRVTPRQLKQWLLVNGKFTTVEAVLNALPEPNRTAAKIDWDSALYFERSHPLIASLAQILGMSSGEVDQAFRESAQID